MRRFNIISAIIKTLEIYLNNRAFIALAATFLLSLFLILTSYWLSPLFEQQKEQTFRIGFNPIEMSQVGDTTFVIKKIMVVNISSQVIDTINIKIVVPKVIEDAKLYSPQQLPFYIKKLEEGKGRSIYEINSTFMFPKDSIEISLITSKPLKDQERIFVEVSGSNERLKFMRTSEFGTMK